jgi:outer membrane immunogenic protein
MISSHSSPRATLLVGAAIAALLTTPAFAQSADTRAALSGPWTGPYIGLTGGATLQRERSSDRVMFDTDLNGDFSDTVRTAAGDNAFATGSGNSGFCDGRAYGDQAFAGCREDRDGGEGSIRAGMDWQAGGFVFGIVGDVGATTIKDEAAAFSSTPAAYSFTRKLNGVAGLRARVGVATGPVLTYVTGGGAAGRVKERFMTTNTANAFSPMESEDTRYGYQYGAGMEARATERVTFGLEWMRTELDVGDGLTVRAAQGSAGATNPFIQANASGTDIRRMSDDLDFDSVRLTMGVRF